MNLADFCVTKIISDKRGRAYELYGMTEEQAKEENQVHAFWKGRLFRPAVKQIYEYNCYGRVSIDSKIFLENESPYYAGYKGVR